MYTTYNPPPLEPSVSVMLTCNGEKSGFSDSDIYCESYSGSRKAAQIIIFFFFLCKSFERSKTDEEKCNAVCEVVNTLDKERIEAENESPKKMSDFL